MNQVHIAALDLNLLVVLHTLLATRSTTDAAKQLGRTQSAVSHALRRLRAVLEDPLFLRMGTKLAPTSFALSIAEPLAAVLEGSAKIFRGPARQIEPKALRQTFIVSSTDLFSLAILPRLVTRLRDLAPGVDLDVRSTTDSPMERQLLRGEADVCFGKRFKRAGLIVEDVGEEEMVVVHRRGHPAANRPLTIDAYCRFDHVLVAPRGQPGSAIDAVLAPLGKSRRIAVRVPHFTSAVLIASQTDMLTSIPRSFAKALRPFARYGERELPFDSPRFGFEIAYARARENDPALAWFAALFAGTCREVLHG